MPAHRRPARPRRDARSASPGAAPALLVFLALPLAAADRPAGAYGARPDDGRDDRAAIEEAARACEPGDRLVFEPGAYDLDLTRDPGPVAILVRDRSGIAIAGGGATIRVRGFRVEGPWASPSLLRFDGCRDLVVEGLTIEMERAPFSAGTVTFVRGGRFDLQVDPDYPVTGEIRVAGLLGFRGDPPLLSGREFDRFHPDTKVLRPKPQGLRILLRTTIGPSLERDDRVAILHQVYGGNAIDLVRCEGVTIRDVTVHSAPGMGINAVACGDLTLERVRIVPGAGRPLSTTADGIYLSATRGKVEIRECEITATGDDAINIFSPYLAVRAVDSEGRVLSLEEPREWWIAPFDPGDEVEVCDPGLRPRGTARVRAHIPPSGAPAVHRLELEELPPGLRSGDLVTNVTRSPSVRIARSRITANRAHGILLHARDVVVEECVITGSTGPGIGVACDASVRHEFPGARDVVIRGCELAEVNRGRALGRAALAVWAVDAAGGEGPAGVHRSLRIEGNTILDTPGQAIHLGSAQGVVLSGNRIAGACRENPASAPIVLENLEDVRIEGNTLQGRHATAVAGTGCRDVVLSGNDGF